jgi:hypothetical protein
MSARLFCSKPSGCCGAVTGSAAIKIIAGLTAFAGLPRVTLEDSALIAKALAWMRAGLDFAGVLHLAKAEGGEAFVSFDQRFAAVANALSEVKVRGL